MTLKILIRLCIKLLGKDETKKLILEAQDECYEEIKEELLKEFIEDNKDEK